MIARPGWYEALARTLDVFSMGEVELFDRMRVKRSVEARQHLWWLLHDKYDWSLGEIGSYMGYHHTTVLSGIRKARRQWRTPAVTNQCATPASKNTRCSFCVSARIADTTGECGAQSVATPSSCSCNAARCRYLNEALTDSEPVAADEPDSFQAEKARGALG